LDNILLALSRLTRKLLIYQSLDNVKLSKMLKNSFKNNEYMTNSLLADTYLAQSLSADFNVVSVSFKFGNLTFCGK
jgi:hypothetical protein